MQVDLKHKPSYTLAVVTLDPNEAIRVEPGAMVSYSEGVETDTKAEGGLFGGLKRMIAGESFFQNTWTAPARGGEITLAPTLPGDMLLIDVRGEFLLQSGAFVAGESGLTFDSKWGGARGFFGAGTLILLKVSGDGKLIAGCYGAIEERILKAGEIYNIDTGHIVGFDSTIQFKVKKVGSWKSTILGGEGLVCELQGPGRVLMQSRSEGALSAWVKSHIPSQSTSTNS